MILIVKNGNQYASSFDLMKFSGLITDAVAFTKKTIPDLRQVDMKLKCIPVEEELKWLGRAKPGTIGAVIRMSLEEMGDIHEL